MELNSNIKSLSNANLVQKEAEFIGFEPINEADFSQKEKIVYWREKSHYYKGMYEVALRRIKRLYQKIDFMKKHPGSKGTKFKKKLKKGLRI
jgi:hypothetical protein